MTTIPKMWHTQSSQIQGGPVRIFRTSTISRWQWRSHLKSSNPKGFRTFKWTNTSENLWRRLMMHVLVQTPALQRWWKHLQCHIHQSCSGWVGPRIEESVAQIEISMRKMITKVDLSFFRCPIFRQASLLLWNQPLMRSPLGQRCRRHRTESWPGRLAEHLRLHQALHPSPVSTWSHLKYPQYPQMVYLLMSQNASRCLASP